MQSWQAPWLFLVVLLVAVLCLSGFAKIRSVQETEDAIRAMGLPKAVQRRWVAAALPWIEIGCAAALILAPAGIAIAPAAAVTVLFCTYLVLVIRIVRSGTATQCACFGTLFDGLVTRRTVVRNALLLSTSALMLGGFLTGASALTVVRAMGTSDGLWALAACTGIAIALSLGRGTPVAQEGHDVDDYIRRPIPVAVVSDLAGNSRSLTELAATQARLLLFLSPGCIPCRGTAELIPHWNAVLSPVAVHAVVKEIGQFDTDFPDAVPYGLLTDEADTAPRSLGIIATPSAVLLGTDGLIAGGPVSGLEEITDMVEAIRAEVAAFDPSATGGADA